MKEGKLAFQTWLSCPFNKHTVVDLPSSVLLIAYFSKMYFDNDSKIQFVISYKKDLRLGTLLYSHYLKDKILGTYSSGTNHGVVRNKRVGWILCSTFIDKN